MILNILIICLHEPACQCHGKTRYFLVFCVLEEIYRVVHGDDAILRIIIFMLLSCYD